MRQAPALISLLLVSLLLLGNLGTAEAVLGPAVGAAGNVWAPYGPFAKSLQFKFYAGAFGAFGAFSDFGSGNLDLVDAPATPGVAAGCLGLGDWTLSPPDPVTGFQTCALTDVGGLVNGLGVAGRGIGGYANFWTALYGRNNPLFVPADPLYTFGGGTTTMRWGLRSGVTSLNPFHAATVSELTVLREIYDSVFKASPVEPSKVFCWMCNSYEIRIGPTGNTHFTIHLKSTIRWHDVALSPFGASDVKFTLLNFRDVPVASTALLADVAPVISVTLLSPNDLDLEMLGVDTPMCSVTYSCLLDRLARVPIIPKDIWGLPGGPPFFYGDVPAADPAKTALLFDPIAAGVMIGSGPFVCRSVFPPLVGAVGTGCTWNKGMVPTGQAVAPEGSMLLQAYDRTGEPFIFDPHLQYFRSFNPGWGLAGPGLTSFSGQFQEFSWADQNDDALVSIFDFASVAGCFGAAAQTPSCTAPNYGYWLKGAFHPGTPAVVSTELFIVADHFDDTWVGPFAWGGLANIVPFTP